MVPPLDRFAQHSLAQEALGPSTATSQSTKAGVERRLKTGLRFTFLQGENCLHPAILVLGSRARKKKKQDQTAGHKLKGTFSIAGTLPSIICLRLCLKHGTHSAPLVDRNTLSHVLEATGEEFSRSRGSCCAFLFSC